jgi:hypothetical protein
MLKRYWGDEILQLALAWSWRFLGSFGRLCIRVWLSWALGMVLLVDVRISFLDETGGFKFVSSLT